MSLGRVVLLLLAVALGAGAVLLVEGNTTIVGLHLGSFAGRAEAPLWLVIASAFLGGAITAGLLVGMVWLIGPFFKVLVGFFFVFILCLAAAVMGMRGEAEIDLSAAALAKHLLKRRGKDTNDLDDPDAVAELARTVTEANAAELTGALARLSELLCDFQALYDAMVKEGRGPDELALARLAAGTTPITLLRIRRLADACLPLRLRRQRTPATTRGSREGPRRAS